MSERPFEPKGASGSRSICHGSSARPASALGRASRESSRRKAPRAFLRRFRSSRAAGRRRVYFTELLKTTSLDAATVRQALIQAGREIDSDFELASLLIDNADKLLVDERRARHTSRRRARSSQTSRWRVCSAGLKRGPVSSAPARSPPPASREIESDFEEASLLVQVAKLQPLDTTTRRSFFERARHRWRPISSTAAC